MEKTISLWTKNWLEKKEIPFCFLEKTKSSNDLAKEQAFKNLSSPFVFLVAGQTQGRGREDKVWKNSDLMLSFLWEKNLKEINIGSSEDFAVDLHKALKAVWPSLPLKVKTPNDLYLGDKKLAGILLEVLNQGSKNALVVGLGLNVLSCPGNLESSCLAEHTRNISFKSWELFLESVFSLWNQRACFSPSLKAQ